MTERAITPAENERLRAYFDRLRGLTQLQQADRDSALVEQAARWEAAERECERLRALLARAAEELPEHYCACGEVGRIEWSSSRANDEHSTRGCWMAGSIRKVGELKREIAEALGREEDGDG